MIEYIFLFIFFSWLIPFIYIKIKYPFWSHQPIYHSYDIFRYWTKYPFIIHPNAPIKTKYLTHKVITKNFLDLDENEHQQMIDMLQSHYIESDQIFTQISKQDVQEDFVGHSNTSYVSFYYNKQLIYDKNSNPPIQEKNMCLGLMTSRAVKIYYHYGMPHEQYSYYWDYLCTHRDFQDQFLGRNLIQNHEKHQRIHNKDICSSLFCRNVSLCEGVVPLIKFHVHTFPLEKTRRPPLGQYTTIRIIGSNVTTLFDFLYNITHSNDTPLFPLCIFPEVNVLDHLIQKKRIIVYALKHQSKTLAFYFFKDPKTCYEFSEERNVLDSIGSVFLQPFDKNAESIFFGGFLHAVHNVQEDAKQPYKLISFYQLTHNSQLIQRWRWKYNPLSITQSAYYLYNAVFPNMPYDENKTLVLL